MKKQLLLGLMAMMAGFTACKKDLVKTPDATPANAKQKINVVDPGTVNELTLAPRQPGENFDTYLGSWGGVSVKMQGTPTWDHDRYPNLVNGVPCTGGGYSVGDQNQIAGSTAGGQSFFIVGVATATFSNQQAFINDLNSYNTAMDTYNRAIASGYNSTQPKASDYVKASYGAGGASYVQVPGKLIRITTGTSHFAFASVTYPDPKIDGSNAQNIGYIPDPTIPSVYYYLYVANGIIYHTDTPNTKVTGTYTTSGPHLTIYHLVGTVTRADGSTFQFDTTFDIA